MNNVQLSPHFTLDEMTHSETADRLGLSNDPDAVQVTSLFVLCTRLLEPIRDLVRVRYKPTAIIQILSGFRSLSVNTVIGGARDSQHMRAQAADIKVPGLPTTELAEMIAKSAIPFDQLILEYPKKGQPFAGWVHISYDTKDNAIQRGQILTCSPTGTVKGLVY